MLLFGELQVEEQQHRLSLDLAFLRFKLCNRASHFEKEADVILQQKLAYNEERYTLQRKFAPLPRNLQAATGVLLRVAVCYRVLQRDAMRYSVFLHDCTDTAQFAGCYRCVAVCCSVLQCVEVCCSELVSVEISRYKFAPMLRNLQAATGVAVCCSVLR